MPDSSNYKKKEEKTYSCFIPFLLMMFSIFLIVGFQKKELAREKEVLKVKISKQDEAFKESKILRKQMDSIGLEIARLAEEGNVNAKIVIEGLKKGGIIISPSSAIK